MIEKVIGLSVVAVAVVLIVILGIHLMLDIRPPDVFGIIAILFVLVSLPATFALVMQASRKMQARLKEMEKERTATIIKEHFGEEVLGCILVRRRVGSILGYSIIQEVLVITPNEVSVEELRTETPQFGGGGSIIHANNKFVIPKSEMTEIRLGKLLQVNFRIITKDNEYKWWVKGLIPEKKGVKLEDYEKILRSAFPDKLSGGKIE